MPKKPCCTKEEKALGKLAQKIAKVVKLKPKKKTAMQPKVYMENNTWTSKGAYFEPQHIQMTKAPLNPYAPMSKNALSLSDIQSLFNGAPRTQSESANAYALPTAQSQDLQDMMLESRLNELNKYVPKGKSPEAKALERLEAKEREVKTQPTKKEIKRYEKILEKSAHIPVEERDYPDYNKVYQENLRLVNMKNPNVPVVSSYPHKTPEDLEEENLGQFKISDDNTYYKTKVYYDDDVKEEKRPEDKYKITLFNGKRRMSNGNPINVSQLTSDDRNKLLKAYNIITTKQNKLGGTSKKKKEELEEDIRLYERKEGISELMRIHVLLD